MTNVIGSTTSGLRTAAQLVTSLESGANHAALLRHQRSSGFKQTGGRAGADRCQEDCHGHLAAPVRGPIVPAAQK
jgi:hypothetical protein